MPMPKEYFKDLQERWRFVWGDPISDDMINGLGRDIILRNIGDKVPFRFEPMPRG